MKKKSAKSMRLTSTTATIIIMVVILSAFALIIISWSLTGKITQLPQQPFEQIIKKTQGKATIQPNDLMVQINQALIEKAVLAEIQELPEDECKYVLVYYQPKLVEKITKEVEETVKIISLPFKATAFAAVAEFSFPYVTEELVEKQRKTTINKLVIKELHKAIVKEFTEDELTDVHTFKNIEGASGCLFQSGIDAIIEEEYEVKIADDIFYETTVHESIKLIKADDVWKRQVNNQDLTGKGVNVAIIDSGIDYTHPDLGGCMGPECKVIKGWNTLANNEDVMDTDGHGTHLAGIVASVAPDANLIAVKACHGGLCSASKIAKSIDWCLDNDCHVATLSLGDRGSHTPDECKKLQTLKPAFEAANEKGFTIFVSSGNEGKNWPAYPACDAIVTSVGSVNDFDDSISDFSNLHPDILAPGVSITSTWPDNNHAIMAGTSQAAAFAAATAALYIQVYAAVKKRAPTPLLIEEQFETTGELVYDKINDIKYPRINVAALISTLIGEEPLPSFICGNSKCEFRLGEDAQNCPPDCEVDLVSPIPTSKINHTLSFEIKDWQEKITPVRIEIRNEGSEGVEIFVKDFMYDYTYIPETVPEGIYDVKLSHGSFSAILRSINMNQSLNLKVKLEDVSKQIQKLSESDAQIKAVYALGYNGSVIICFDRRLSGNNTFVFRCPWNGSCKENWNPLMSMTPKETSCILLAPGKGTAFAVAEIPEAVCGNGICEPEAGENDANCPQDCRFKEASIIIKEKRPIWPLIMIFAIGAILIAIGIFLKKIKGKQEKKLKLVQHPKSPSSLPKPPKPPKPPKRK